MQEPKFQFSQVVVVDEDNIGVIVKSWENMNQPDKPRYHYEVYVRSYNGIRDYQEDEIDFYIYNKVLAEDELDFYE